MIRSLQARLAIALATMIIAGAGFAAVAVFLCMAVYLQIASMVSPGLAALFSALAAFAFSMAVLFIGMLLQRARAARFRGFRELAGASPAVQLGAIFGAQARAFASSKSRVTLIGALAAGFAFGASPKLRSMLGDLLS